jgi:hypothetical protein
VRHPASHICVLRYALNAAEKTRPAWGSGPEKERNPKSVSYLFFFFAAFFLAAMLSTPKVEVSLGFEEEAQRLLLCSVTPQYVVVFG